MGRRTGPRGTTTNTSHGDSSEAEPQAARLEGSRAEAAVIRALRRGDEEAFTRLVDQHHASLRRIARLFVSSPEVADEVVQDTWLAVIRGIWAFEGRSSLRTWILRILVNRARTRAQREGRTVSFAEAGVEDSAGPARAGSAGDAALDGPRAGAGHARGPAARASLLLDPGPSPESMLLTREARHRVRAAIEALPAAQRTVITLRDLEGYSSAAVCNVLGLGETNQRVLLHRARSKVRARLSGYLREG